MTGYEVVTYKGFKPIGIPYSRSHIDRLEKRGRFPKSFKLEDHPNSPRVWWLREVHEWLEHRSIKR